VGHVLDTMDTPAVLLDLGQLESNLEGMQRLADRHGVALRPHAKTHKSIEIGRRQVALGAVGLTVATVDEALVFLKGGCDSITISRPLVSLNAYQRLFAEESARTARLSVVVDSEVGVDTAAECAVEAACTLGVFIKIDVGLRRCGVEPSSAAPLELGRRIGQRQGLEFRGILSHAGQVYAVASPAKATAIAEQERQLMLGVRDTLIAEGVPVAEVSVGSTPTVLAATGMEGITEIRPGNYTFLDLLPVRVGVVTEASVALTVLATIVSKNTDFFVTDAGSKTLTSDTGGHGMGSADGFGAAYPVDGYLSQAHRLTVAGLSEEHGKLARTGFDLPVGSKVRIIPNHSCPVANLSRSYTVLNDGEVEVWPVDAAGCSR
jgi:D-serine deaminase-like pyridoxal phosphate-dependent protein